MRIGDRPAGFLRGFVQESYMRKSLSAMSLAILAAVAGWSCNQTSPAEPSPSACTYTLSTNSLSFGPSGGSNSVTLTTASHCSWSATSDRVWIAISSGSSGTGNGAVTVALTANTTDSTRTGTLTVASQAVAVSQQGETPCTYDISPPGAAYNKDAATGSFAVSAAASCAWNATSNVSWVTIRSGDQGTGNGTVAYAVERNFTTTSRTGTITAAGKTFTITQTGDVPLCEYSVSPVTFNPCMSVPFELTANVTAPQGCTWTAAPDASWITLTSPPSSSGSGVVRFRVSDNWDAPRQAIVMVRWPTATAGQNLLVSQAGCRYAVSVASFNFAIAGGTGRFDVIQQSEPLTCGGALQDACLWTAEADVPWITITSSMPRRGDDPVNFTVAANTGPPRSGTIRVRDKVVQINQGGQ